MTRCPYKMGKFGERRKKKHHQVKVNTERRDDVFIRQAMPKIADKPPAEEKRGTDYFALSPQGTNLTNFLISNDYLHNYLATQCSTLLQQD